MNKTDKRKLDEFYCYLHDIAYTDTPIAIIAFKFSCKFLGFHNKVTVDFGLRKTLKET